MGNDIAPVKQVENIKSERDYFPFMLSFKEAIKRLNAKDKLAIYEAITDYSFYREVPELKSPMAQMAWELIEPVLTKSWVRFRAKKGKTKRVEIILASYQQEE